MSYTITDIQQLLGAKWLQSVHTEARIDGLLIDSRHVVSSAYALFFALKGERHDGHQHVMQAYNQGVRHFVVSHDIERQQLPEANILRVPNTLLALQVLAAKHRALFDHLNVIGITGSNGKTIVKEWLWQIISQDFKVVRSPKSYNSQVGVPLSLWQIQAHHQIALIEAGISKTGEMQRLADMVHPTVGLFTNVGPAHREGFKDDAEKVSEKMLLFKDVKTLLYCQDHKLVHEAALRLQGPEFLTWSVTENADIRVENKQISDGITEIHLYPGTKPASLDAGRFPPFVRFQIPFSDPASIENAVHCWVMAYYLGCSIAQIEERMARLEPIEMRLELMAGIQNSIVINDAYNNDISSLKIALQFARQQTRKGKFTLVLSDILQSGMEQPALWAEVAEVLKKYMGNKDNLLAVGDDIVHLKPFLPNNDFGKRAMFFKNTPELVAQVGLMDWRDQIVLLKGARNFEFERIAVRLEQKAHKTVLEVNLSAMVHNLNTYNRLLQPGTKMMAMVKAAGYGSGSAEVAKLLEFHAVDYLGVAYTDEGIELRKAGIQLPILVLNPDASAFDAMYRYRLEPEIYSLALFQELINYCGTEKRMDIHLKVDTGMHRLGFVEQDVPALLKYQKSHPNLEVKSIFTHLSASDNPTHDAFTHEQARKFSAMYEQIVADLAHRPIRHVCNTGGIYRFPAYHFDMVRLGIGLYGIDGSGLQDQLRVVNTLKASISQIKTIPAGDSVGYNRNSGILVQTKRIATISIGYADGFLRMAGGGRYAVYVQGKPAATIGNVCMDMTMVDVTNIPSAKAGDEVIVFGEMPTVHELANCLQTIAYEVFTNISERVKRVYWQE